MEDHGQNVDLPPEIIHDIISRLPVKPLCRFKCVSKPWRSLISDPDFIAKYSKAVENKDVFFQRRRLVFSFGDRRDQHGLYSLDLDQFLNYKNDKVDYGLVSAAEATELDFVYNHRGRDGWVPFFHSCNGLLLSQLRSARDLGLVNPVTKKSKKLPKIPTWRLPEKPFFWWLYGFGFDYSTNEYKVVNGQFYYDVGIVFSVYTLETDSWRQIECLFPYKPINYDGIVLNGGVHWLVWAFDSLAILSFVLAEEEVREIPLPPIGSTSSIHLGVFRDWLCMTLSSPRTQEETFNEFWVMKEYGVRESWTKMRVSKPYHQLSHTGFWTESHDLMVFDRSSLVMYNFNDDSSWDLSFPGISKHGDFCNVGIYVESLMPSLIDQEQHQRRSKEDLVKKGVNKLNALSDILCDCNALLVFIFNFVTDHFYLVVTLFLYFVTVNLNKLELH